MYESFCYKFREFFRDSRHIPSRILRLFLEPIFPIARAHILSVKVIRSESISPTRHLRCALYNNSGHLFVCCKQFAYHSPAASNLSIINNEYSSIYWIRVTAAVSMQCLCFLDWTQQPITELLHLKGLSLSVSSIASDTYIVFGMVTTKRFMISKSIHSSF